MGRVKEDDSSGVAKRSVDIGRVLSPPLGCCCTFSFCFISSPAASASSMGASVKAIFLSSSDAWALSDRSSSSLAH